MWYVELNGKIIPTPYQFYEDCMAACRHYQETMVAVCATPVWQD